VRQRGSLLLYLGMAIAALGLVYLLAQWVDDNLVTEAGVKAGGERRDAEYQKRDAKALADALAAKKRAEEDKAALEKTNAELLAKAGADYTKGLADGKVDLDRAIARARAGARLRDPGRTAGATVCPGGATAEARPGAGGGDGAKGAELSLAATEFLLGLAAEADDVVRQLTSAQAVIRACQKLYAGQ
jgi:hypothetical protein